MKHIVDNTRVNEIELTQIKASQAGMITLTFNYKGDIVVYKPLFVADRGWCLISLAFDAVFINTRGGLDPATHGEQGCATLTELLQKNLRSCNMTAQLHASKREVFEYIGSLVK